MTASPLRHRVCSSIARFWSERRGIAAVEFALILPVIVFIYLGSVEVAEAISIQRMVGLCAGTVANITTQYPVISASQTMPGILGASSQVLTPYPSANAVVRVSYITIDATGRATVGWSQALNGTALPTGQAVTLRPRSTYPARAGRLRPDELRLQSAVRLHQFRRVQLVLVGLHVRARRTAPSP